MLTERAPSELPPLFAFPPNPFAGMRGVFYDFWNLLLDPFILFRQHFLDLESSHTTASGTGDRLSISLILNIASSKHSPDARLRRAGDGQDVPIGINLKLVTDKSRGGFVTDGVEKTGYGKVLFFAA